MDIVTRLDAWFVERLRGLPAQPETIAYVGGVLVSLGHPDDAEVFAERSLVLAYQDAVLKGDFLNFQLIGDWILWASIIFPEHLSGVRELVDGLGCSSYRACHRILRGQWQVYAELADGLPTLTRRAHELLKRAGSLTKSTQTS
jgi:hypothetical protein